MSKQIIKIPQGQIHILFENNGQSFDVTAKILWDALCDYMFKGEQEPEKPAVKHDFDDEHPDYIRSSQEEM